MTRRTFVLLLLLILVAACGCVPSEAADSTWWIHGIAVTESGAPVGGGTVELWRISGNEWALLATRVSASQAWGFEVRQMSARYRVVYVAPVGWRCVSVRSAGVGWQFPGQCTGEIALPEQEPSIGPDLVFIVAYAATPPPVPTATPTVQEPTKTATPRTPTATPQKTPTATAVFTEIPTPPRATPTPFCQGGYMQLPWDVRLSIRDTALMHLYRLEDTLEPFDDPTLIAGLREFSTPPLGRAFVFVTNEGVELLCRPFVDGIIAIDECAPCRLSVILWDAGWAWTESGYVWEGR